VDDNDDNQGWTTITANRLPKSGSGLGSTVVVAVERPSGFALGSVASCAFLSATTTWFQAKSTRNSASARAHLLQLLLYPPRRDSVASGLAKFLKAG